MSEHDDRLVRRVVAAASGRDAADACPDAEVLGLYAERQLDGAERVGVETHVAGCARCQATLAAFVRSAPVAVGIAGAGVREDAGAGGAAWWSGWKWLVPLAATAAVVTIAVWVRRPDMPSEGVVREQTAAEAAMGQPVQSGRAAPAGPAGPAGGASATSAPGAATDRPTQAPTETGPVESALRPTAPPAPPAASTLADARGRTAPVAAPPPAPVTTAEARQEAVAVPTPEGRAKALAAGAREADAVADARERSTPAAPVPPPPAAAAPAAPREAEAFARRQAENVQARRADAATPAQTKAAVGQESPARSTAGGALGATAAAAPAKRPAQLTGRVTYRTRAALPAGAVVDVRLLDVSRTDAPATLLGRVEIVTRGEQVPVPFAIGYDAAAIDSRFRYAVQVTITVAGRVAYRTTTAHPVLTRGAPATNVEVVVEPMR